MGAVTLSRYLDCTPTAYLHRATHGLLADLPQWFRWGLAWVALIGAMMIACSVLAIVASLALGVV